MTVLPTRVKFVRTHEDAKLPTKGSEGAVGFDIYSNEDVDLISGGVPTIVRTGLKICIPEGFEGQVRSRSGLATKGVCVVNAPGTIDPDYRGELCVILTYLYDVRSDIFLDYDYFHISKGDRIAQLVIKPVVPNPVMVEVEEFDETKRGEKGFGSTGN